MAAAAVPLPQLTPSVTSLKVMLLNAVKGKVCSLSVGRDVTNRRKNENPVL